MLDTNCLFCKIVRGEIPATKVYEDENVVLFNDIAPKAEVHIIAIPKVHYADIVEFSAASSSVNSSGQNVAHFMQTITEKATELSPNGEFKLVFNTGEMVGQTIFHVHGHILAGKGAESVNV